LNKCATDKIFDKKIDGGAIVVSVGATNARREPPKTKLPDWAERIALIRAALSDITTEFIDRRQIAELFGVSPSRAGRLIHTMGPMLHGNSLVVDADDVRKMLAEVEKEKEIRDLRRWLADKEAELTKARQRARIG
jgi:hypothetical protein